MIGRTEPMTGDAVAPSRRRSPSACLPSIPSWCWSCSQRVRVRSRPASSHRSSSREPSRSSIAIARWAPRWIRGVAMLVVGFAGIAVTAGAIAKRVAMGIDVSAVLGVLFAFASLTLVVIGWRRWLQGMHHAWTKATVAVVGSLIVAQFVLLPATFAIDVTNRARPQESGRTPAGLGLAFRNVRITTPDGVELAAWWIPSRNGAAVLVLPGAGSTRDDVLGSCGAPGSRRVRNAPAGLARSRRERGAAERVRMGRGRRRPNRGLVGATPTRGHASGGTARALDGRRGRGDHSR